jgi:hypothetical protein
LFSAGRHDSVCCQGGNSRSVICTMWRRQGWLLCDVLPGLMFLHSGMLLLHCILEWLPPDLRLWLTNVASDCGKEQCEAGHSTHVSTHGRARDSPSGKHAGSFTGLCTEEPWTVKPLHMQSLGQWSPCTGTSAVRCAGLSKNRQDCVHVQHRPCSSSTAYA